MTLPSKKKRNLSEGEKRVVSLFTRLEKMADDKAHTVTFVCEEHQAKVVAKLVNLLRCVPNKEAGKWNITLSIYQFSQYVAILAKHMQITPTADGNLKTFDGLYVIE